MLILCYVYGNCVSNATVLHTPKLGFSGLGCLTRDVNDREKRWTLMVAFSGNWPGGWRNGWMNTHTHTQKKLCSRTLPFNISSKGTATWVYSDIHSAASL